MPESRPLFTSDDLGSWLGSSVDPGRGEVVERVVWGWLRPILLEGAERPADVSPELFSWALELGAIAYENPAGLSSKQFGDVAEAYGGERRDEILEAVAGSSIGIGALPGSSVHPRGSFPSARPYPDALGLRRVRREC
jgi:hypothetical protein